MATAFKKLVNDVSRCVEDSLEGFVEVNPGLRLIRDQPVIVREDLEEYKKEGKVTILSGGGSGHEPGQIGFVGKGALTAAIAGPIFTSPPPANILAALRLLGHNSSAGTMIIVPNYTGDRLNFGIAVERARIEGLKVEIVQVGEDCALVTSEKTAGRRGLSGLMFMHKIAGALAEEGKTLEEIVRICLLTSENMGSLGISLTSCSLPGKDALFSIDKDEMELGLGVHGEAGVKRVKVMTAKETAALMLDHMTNPESANHLSIKKGDGVAIIINNLGGTTNLELYIMARDIIKKLEQQGVSVERAYCGPLLTSLEMAGLTLTILHLDDDRRRCLDAPVNAPAWPRILLSKDSNIRKTPPLFEQVKTPEKKDEDFSKIAELSETRSKTVLKAIVNSCQVLIASEDKLNMLDKICGNGTYGSTMKRGAQGILKLLEDDVNVYKRPFLLFQKISTICEETMGGSSGALYTLFFSAVASALQDKVSMDCCIKALRVGIEALIKYGGAEPGDRTMIDSLYAALEVLESVPLSSGSDHYLLFDRAVKAAEQAAVATSTMKAHAGRASYVSTALLTEPDAGATGAALWLSAISKTLADEKKS